MVIRGCAQVEKFVLSNLGDWVISDLRLIYLMVLLFYFFFGEFFFSFFSFLWDLCVGVNTTKKMCFFIVIILAVVN